MMNAASRTESAVLPLPLARQVETAYQRFESAWRAGERPLIEDHLVELPAPARPVLFPELLELELSCRRRAGETVLPDEYRRRFPEHAALIGSIFRESSGAATAAPTGPGTDFEFPMSVSESASEIEADEINADEIASGQREGDDVPLPPRLGRYRVTARLGAGGYGVVYKAHDDELRRDVAIKVPHRHRIATAADIDAYLAEARMLATLDHPGIVPVHDVGRTADGLCYVVSKFVAGQDLRSRLRQARPACAEAAALVAQVAEALHHAHRRGLVHRDIKPANILLDEQGRPVVADFGLALRDADFGTGPQIAGTPAYMSPEQARGEGHRVDARTDVYSLGIVFYEMLSGQRPVRGERPEDVLEQIKTLEPRPPRQVNDAVPAELDRICLRALAKRASDRYSTAQDLAVDLRDWLAAAQSPAVVPAPASLPAVLPAVRAQVTAPSNTAVDAASMSVGNAATQRGPVKVVPKGLRAYDAADADFFLELLPGPRDRYGLPDSLRFWKRRIEETDPDQTFSVGLLYGPSGCGKSSLVKAGLLPRLAPHVRAVYVEATPGETEARLLKSLRKRCPELPDNLGLIETLAELRRRGGSGIRSQGSAVRRQRARLTPDSRPLTPDPKVLLVLDQFEQWLHAKGSEQHTELVQALRQCDGEHVQCLVLVRDDFGMAATRFMNELEIRIAQGHNFATVDLFDPGHARKVLTEFGRAFGQLPASSAELTPEQERFLDQTVAGLAQDGRVISVRLALFAEMVKGKPWTPATLRQVGGAEGVGVTFLEETFSAATAPPPHRLHQKAARAVLKALLPEPGADLKGHRRSHQELRDAAGYSAHPQEFADLLRILDTELRLVTPTDLEEVSGGAVSGGAVSGESSSGSLTAHQSTNHQSPTDPSPRYYQLTHDYLVPAVRQWLTRKQRETRQGRIELLLAERVALWSVKQDNRQLPGWWEWLNILVWTRSRNRTDPQRRMMRAATRRHLLQGVVVLVAATLFFWFLGEVYRGPVKAAYLVRALASADIESVDQIIAELDTCRRWADPKLRDLALESSSPKERLHASLALLPDPEQVAYLEKRLLEVGPLEIGPDEALVVARRLSGAEHGRQVATRLQKLLKTERIPGRRFRAACALSILQPGKDWKEFSDEVVEELAKKDLPSALKWSRLPMEGNGEILFESLKRVFLDANRPESERSHAAALVRFTFLTYSISSTKELMDFVLEVEGEPYGILNDWFIAGGQDAADLLQDELDKLRPADAETVDNLARRQAHAAVILLQLEDWYKRRGPLDQSEPIRADRVWPLLRDSPDPRLHSLRSYLSHRFARVDVQADVLVKGYQSEQNASARRALLLSLGEYKDYQLPAAAQKPLVQRLQQDYLEDPDPGIHSALDWLLRQWTHQKSVEEIDRALTTGKVEGKRQWYLTARQGHTLAVIPGPAAFTMGSPKQEPDRRPEETPHRRHIPRSFAIATKEVTVRQFREFLEANPNALHDWGPTERHSPNLEPDDGPVLGVTWFAAAKYCRWLSEQEGIPNEQMCYPAIAEIKDGMSLPQDYLARTGYRLPTEAEWEYACRAAAVTSRPYGSADALLGRYARYDRNAHGRAGRVGSLKPNDLGMFDMLGNAWEWCHDALADYPAESTEDGEQPGAVRAEKPRVLRGGSLFSAAPELRCAHRIGSHPQATFSQAGFRVARTWR